MGRGALAGNKSWGICCKISTGPRMQDIMLGCPRTCDWPKSGRSAEHIDRASISGPSISSH